VKKEFFRAECDRRFVADSSLAPLISLYLNVDSVLIKRVMSQFIVDCECGRIVMCVRLHIELFVYYLLEFFCDCYVIRGRGESVHLHGYTRVSR
jgi:hypothetical protein